ncbi:hypothetical protein DFH29DRAFT_985968 [Suillus ampliporus]|nr:hypothetical protein DFH29DRAFT_985968 [Suillus ampliporus]
MDVDTGMNDYVPTCLLSPPPADTDPHHSSLLLVPEVDANVNGESQQSEYLCLVSNSSFALEVDSEFYGPGKKMYRNYHTGLNARPCDESGDFLPLGTPPCPLTEQSPDDWVPFCNRMEFETAKFLFSRTQMSAPNINTLLDLWATLLLKHHDHPPFADHKDLYKTINNIPIGGINWQSFNIQYSRDKPAESDVPLWMSEWFDVWYHDPCEVAWNILANPDYVNEFDYCPFCKFSVDKDEHRFQDFMSADWAWQQVDIIATDPSNLGATFVPIILGSDKMTVSVGTGNNEYYPLYMSISNVCNNVCQAHQNALSSTKEHAETGEFRNFQCQIFHSSLTKILDTLKDAMSKPEIVCFSDGHYRHVIYGLGPYIADYEEQVLLTSIVRRWCLRCLAPCRSLDNDALCQCEAHREALFEEDISSSVLQSDFGIVGEVVPFMNDFPRADIHQLIAPDLLHQIIKGCFKDHLVAWVEKYLHHIHGKHEAEHIMDDIDQHLAAAVPFTGLQCFLQGHGFKQWTGDDSKALMKIYLPAIEGHLLTDIICTFHAFLEFCYLVQKNVIMEDTISQIEDTIHQFHHHRQIFHQLGVIPTFSLPRQHLMKHYPDLICLFGALNGLCSSMMENKHIKAVKQLWCWLSRYNVLGQMLVMNQWLDKLATLHIDFTKRSMLNGSTDNAPDARMNTTIPDVQIESSADLDDSKIDDGLMEVEAQFDTHYNITHHNDRTQTCTHCATALAIELSILHLQELVGRFLFEQLHPHDLRDHATIPAESFPVYDGKLSVVNSASSRFYTPSDPTPDEDMGTWIVQPSFDGCSPNISVIHINAIYCAAHLLPIYGTDYIPHNINFYHSLDAFCAFYINKFADHHGFEIAF